MNCEFSEVAPGIYQCGRPGCGRRNLQPLPGPPRAVCLVPDPPEKKPAKFNPTRTNEEIEVILATWCSTCNHYHPDEPKRKCHLAGCGSVDFLEDRLRRRLFKCPKSAKFHPPADCWTEEDLQRAMAENRSGGACA